jgi:hypothetical protein
MNPPDLPFPRRAAGDRLSAAGTRRPAASCVRAWPGGRVTRAFVFRQKVVAIVSPGIMAVDVKQAYDDRFLKKIEELGFNNKVGMKLP